MSFHSYMIYTLDYYQNRVSFIPMFIVGNKTNIFFWVFFGLTPRLTQPFILQRSIKWVPGISGKLVVKSKLTPQSGTSLEAVEPHP